MSISQAIFSTSSGSEQQKLYRSPSTDCVTMKPAFEKAFEEIGYSVFPANVIPDDEVKKIFEKEHSYLPPNCSVNFIRNVNRLLFDILTNPYHRCENIVILSNYLYSFGMGQYYVDSVLFHFCSSWGTSIPEISVLLNSLHIEHISLYERKCRLTNNLLIIN